MTFKKLLARAEQTVELLTDKLQRSHQCQHALETRLSALYSVVSTCKQHVQELTRGRDETATYVARLLSELKTLRGELNRAHADVDAFRRERDALLKEMGPLRRLYAFLDAHLREEFTDIAHFDGYTSIQSSALQAVLRGDAKASD